MSLENQNDRKRFPPVKNRLIFHCAFNFYLQVRLFPLHIGSSLSFAQSYWSKAIIHVEDVNFDHFSGVSEKPLERNTHKENAVSELLALFSPWLL